MRIRLDNQGSVRDTSSAGPTRAGRAIEFAVLFMVALSLVMTAPATAAPPGDWFESQKLMPPDLSAGDTFGGDIVVEGDRAIIGCIRKNSLRGVVYDYRLNPGTRMWEVRGQLPSPALDSLDFFGSSIAISGDWVLVGAYGDDDGGNEAGAVHVYEFVDDDWVYREKVIAPDPESGAYFSLDLEVQGEWAFIGARQKDEYGDRTGTTYLYRLQGGSWVYQSRVDPPDLASLDFYATSISATDDWVVIGAHQDSRRVLRGGAFYIFERIGSTWVLDGKYYPSGVEANDRFGQVVGIEGTRIIVGSDAAEEIYVYDYDGMQWNETGTIVPSDGLSGDRFGSACDIHGTTIVAGASGHDSGAGAAYVFTPSLSGGWEEQKLTASDGDAPDGFGQIVSITDDFILAASMNDDNQYGTDAGATYVFKYPGSRFGLIVDPDPLRGREPGVFEITDARPERKTWLLYSFDGEGMTYIPQLKVAVDLAYPRIGFGPKATDEVGYVAWMYFIPGVGQPVDIWFQAVQKRATSNVIATQIVP